METIKTRIVSSDWLGLSEHLIAKFWPVDYDGKRIATDNVQEELHTAIMECNLEAVFTWQSQFENSDVSGVKPTLAAAIQTGLAGDLAKAFGVSDDFLDSLRGRTGITKLNSTQVFIGMEPVKFTITLLFRAWNDPQKEVEDCLNLLSKWSYPQYLSPLGPPLSRAAEAKQKLEAGSPLSKELVNLVFPSKAPSLVAMLYKNRTYKPLSIKSIGVPISSPVDENGKFVELAIPINLATLTAMDQNDWVNTIKFGR